MHHTLTGIPQSLYHSITLLQSWPRIREAVATKAAAVWRTVANPKGAAVAAGVTCCATWLMQPSNITVVRDSSN
jgi:hypothetical protein